MNGVPGSWNKPLFNMKNIIAIFITCSVLFFGCGQDAPQTPASAANAAPTASPELPRAKDGEEVWVILTFVKADKKADYEKWMREVFFAALHKTQSQQLKDQMKTTRWLTPKGQNEDKSWTYAFLMDPVVPNGDYDITSLLNKEYGEEKGKAYWEQYQSFWAKPVEAHVLNQANY